MTQVSVRQARDNLSQLIKDVQAGEEVVIASHGRPVARIVAVRSPARLGLAKYFAENPIPAGGRTAAEIDDAIAEQRDSWE